MAFTTDDFSKVWASTSPLTPYSFSESNYKEGWNFIGSTPPARQMWDGIQKLNDEKSEWLYNNKVEETSRGAEYIRFSNGLQIVFGSDASSATFDIINFPVAFISAPAVTFNVRIQTTSSEFYTRVYSVSASGFAPAVFRASNNSAAAVNVVYIAIGFWK